MKIVICRYIYGLYIYLYIEFDIFKDSEHVEGYQLLVYIEGSGELWVCEGWKNIGYILIYRDLVLRRL